MIGSCANVAAVPFSFLGGDRTNDRKSGRAKDLVSGKWGGGELQGGRGEREGGGGGERMNLFSQSQTFYLTPFTNGEQ